MTLAASDRAPTLSSITVPWLATSSDHAADLFSQHGLLAAPQAISSTTAGAANAEVNAALVTTLSLPLAQSSHLLGEIREPLYRHDLKLDLTPCMLTLLQQLLEKSSPLAAAIESALGGEAEQAALAELSCIISEPGARAQPAHCDVAASDHDGASRLVTVFVALHDVDSLMGPTIMWPGTHTPQFHAELKEKGPLFLRSRDNGIGVRMDLRAGGAVLMDGRLWHAGGANEPNSSGRRCLLVVSFASPSRPKGSTYSLLPHLEGRYTLASLRQMNITAAAPAAEAVVAEAAAEEEEEEEVAWMPMQCAKLLQRLALTLPAEEPRARMCREALVEAVSDEAEDVVGVPLSILRALLAFRVLGPHLRTSSKFGLMQRLIDEALAEDVSEQSSPAAHKDTTRAHEVRGRSEGV